MAEFEPRHIAPAGSYSRRDDRLSVKIYKKCNPNFLSIDFDETWERSRLIDNINRSSDQSCYDGAGFAIITRFAPEQKRDHQSLINIGIWSGVMPKKTVIKVHKNSATQEHPGNNTWCIYETLGVVNFEAGEWKKFLKDKTPENFLEYLANHAPEVVID